jgi:hypothetical protein
VNFHIQNVLCKLRAQNKIQAAVKAATLGVLTPGRGSALPDLSSTRGKGGRRDRPPTKQPVDTLPGLRAWHL